MNQNRCPETGSTRWCKRPKHLDAQVTNSSNCKFRPVLLAGISGWLLMQQPKSGSKWVRNLPTLLLPDGCDAVMARLATYPCNSVQVIAGGRQGRRVASKIDIHHCPRTAMTAARLQAGAGTAGLLKMQSGRRAA
jgi:hypothetical protein